MQRAELEHKPGAPLPWDQTRNEVFGLIVELFEEGPAQGAFQVGHPALAGMMLPARAGHRDPR